MSLPNGMVAMKFGECPSCERAGHTVGDGQPHGINCGGCGHHFHIGDGTDTPLVKTAPIFCPRCEGACLPVEIAASTEGER